MILNVTSDVGFDYSSFLNNGADERIFLNREGFLKYGIPVASFDVINRGSCTCSAASEYDINLLSGLLQRYSEEKHWIEQIDRNTDELMKLVDPGNDLDFELFYAPSGTDLMYYPLMFSKLIDKNKKILNVVTRIEELGSGSRQASEGKTFSDYDQFGKRLNKPEGFVDRGFVRSVFFSARDKDGKIRDHNTTIEEVVAKYPDRNIIINLVYGSKSGIEDDLSLIDKLDNSNIIWNIDLCQFRHDSDVIQRLLKKNAMTMITGSKFFQSPPFCAALLVPKEIVDQLKVSNNWDEISSFRNFFSRYDVPVKLRDYFQFSNNLNISNAIRWTCAIEEMKRYFSLPRLVRDSMVSEWNRFIRQEMTLYQEFELMPDQHLTLDSIISFRVKWDDRYLDHDELKKLHYSIVTDDYSRDYDFKNVFIGQPVAYGDHSFLRMAIGAKNVRGFIETGKTQFPYDRSILKIIQSKLKTHYAPG